jgi:N-acetylglutamate synthase
MPSMRARLVVAVDADDVGSRVSVRYLLEGDRPTDPDALMTDVVGQLEAWTGSHALIRRRTGEVVQVPIPAIVAAKVVPPAPLR